MRDCREWWLQQAKGIPVNQKIKVNYLGERDKSASVTIGNSQQCYWAKCYRRGTSDVVFKDVVNLAEIAKAQEVSAKTDLPTDMETFNPSAGDWVTKMAVDYLLKRNIDPALCSLCYLSRSRLRLIYEGNDTKGNEGFIGRDITEKHKAKVVNYHFQGKRLANIELHTFGLGSVVLTEDINSALKIQEAVRRYGGGLASKVISLNGTSGSSSLTLACADEDVVIWLDGDEAGEAGAIKLIKDLRILAKSVKIILGDGDPKDYTYTQIQEALELAKVSENVLIDIKGEL